VHAQAVRPSLLRHVGLGLDWSALSHSDPTRSRRMHSGRRPVAGGENVDSGLHKLTSRRERRHASGIRSHVAEHRRHVSCVGMVGMEPTPSESDVSGPHFRLSQLREERGAGWRGGALQGRAWRQRHGAGWLRVANGSFGQRVLKGQVWILGYWTQCVPVSPPPPPRLGTCPASRGVSCFIRLT
jgi:hypothetical protein